MLFILLFILLNVHHNTTKKCDMYTFAVKEWQFTSEVYLHFSFIVLAKRQ